LERAVSGREYVALVKSSDTSKAIVIKKVQCFLWNSIYYELQTYVKPDIGLTVLKTEVEPGKNFAIPWFLQVRGEITGIKEFSSYGIADMYAGSNPKESGLTWKHNMEMMEAYLSAKEQSKREKDAQDI